MFRSPELYTRFIVVNDLLSNNPQTTLYQNQSVSRIGSHLVLDPITRVIYPIIVIGINVSYQLYPIGVKVCYQLHPIGIIGNSDS